jgi:hypothetical protein
MTHPEMTYALADLEIAQRRQAASAVRAVRAGAKPGEAGLLLWRRVQLVRRALTGGALPSSARRPL